MIYNDEKGYKKCFDYKNSNNIDIKSDKLKITWLIAIICFQSYFKNKSAK